MNKKSIKKMNKLLAKIGKDNAYPPLDTAKDVPADVALSIFTGYGLALFGDIHKWAEKLLGRPVWTSEFAQEDLWDDMSNNLVVCMMNDLPEMRTSVKLALLAQMSKFRTVGRKEARKAENGTRSESQDHAGVDGLVRDEVPRQEE